MVCGVPPGSAECTCGGWLVALRVDVMRNGAEVIITERRQRFVASLQGMLLSAVLLCFTCHRESGSIVGERGSCVGLCADNVWVVCLHAQPGLGQ